MTQDQNASDQNGQLSRFEDSLADLEALVKQLEQGDLPLEEALKAFEKGVTLTRQCQKSLREAEQRVEQVMENQAGELERQPFRDDSNT